MRDKYKDQGRHPQDKRAKKGAKDRSDSCLNCLSVII